MRTNIDYDPVIASRGTRVQFKPFQLTEDVPKSWLGIGTVVGLCKDPLLTEMNRRNIIIYRILIDFGDDSPASVLPRCLTRQVSKNLDTSK